jgi:cytochrome c-type biogenesis protein CcmH/NrfG
MTDLAEIAYLAYRNGNYRDAIELLLQVTDIDAGNWLARLYLGFAYQKQGRPADAHRLLTKVLKDCPDADVLAKVREALPFLEAEMQKRFNRETNSGSALNAASGV